MINDNLVKCPVCGGFTHVDKPELLAALNDPKIRRKVENYIAELLGPGAGVVPSVAAVQPHGRSFKNDVHVWNPNVPVWRRSPKE